MKKLIIYLFLLLPALSFAPARLYAAPDLFPQCDSSTSSSTICQNRNQPQTHDKNTLYGPDGIITKIAHLYALGAGIVAVILIIIGGLRFVIASGDPANVKNAKNTVLYAVIGLIVTGIAAQIIQYILSKL